MENRQEFVKDIKVLASNYISREYAIDDLHGRDPSQVWDTADIEVWLNALPSIQARGTECEKCYWSDEKGCSIFCRAWNRYTAHGGYCHQYADRRGDSE